MGIKLKSFIIVVDRPQAVYGPGDSVTGNCLIDLEGSMNLSQLTIKLKGVAECHWSVNRVGHQGVGVNDTRRIHAKQILVNLLYSPGLGETNKTFIHLECDGLDYFVGSLSN